ncbi:acetyl-CoA carboxylase biotin carboxylase subunit family protein [Streptomyces sp. NPDC058612]|uniref:ATP-grasp domain-containing protein n=1 Tax=Streptomyces sp. NPDC058612 TaxID=3346555 RepID=UPI0036666D34
MTKIAVIDDGPKSDCAAMLPEVAGAPHVYGHHELAGTEGFAPYEYVRDCEFVPYPEPMTGRSAAADGSFTHLITDNEYDLKRTARLRQDLGNPGRSPQSALSLRDKEMVKRTTEQTVPAARYARPETVTDLTGFVAETGYPVVVKPVRQGSRDIVVLHGDAELVEFARRHWRDGLMVEQFVEGPMYHVDAVIAPGYRSVASSGHLRSCPGAPAGEKDSSLQLHPEEKFAARLEEFLDQLLDAFETPEASAYHLEVLHTSDDRPVLCEIATRVGAHRIPQRTRATHWVDPLRTRLRQPVGLPVPSGPAEAEQVRGSISVVPQGRPVGAPPRPPFERIDHYEVNQAPAPGAKPANSSSHPCFVTVRGAHLDEVEQRAPQTESWRTANLVEPAEEAAGTVAAEVIRT